MIFLPDWVETALLNGGLGVAVFFVLSGFVIAHSLYDKPMSLPEFGRFTLRRSLRLDPAYWASIAVTIAFAALSSYLVSGRLGQRKDPDLPPQNVAPLAVRHLPQ
ncbi:acyltransferase family protein [Neorhizobium galegae]|uniref:acyltransferase family protein n=1 Tax=Neorhizobium galegae TaxID=399 RepID=UPI0012D50A8A|nr:hypothetical protein [Neorhizobium galegae]KAB1123843.1 acyltransferase [Neorhizobium galegae]MCQ1806835.1 hypothetical protein [Neorhizobium galegae]